MTNVVRSPAWTLLARTEMRLWGMEGKEGPKNVQLSNFSPRRNMKINHMYSESYFH